jgi:DNA-binding CsgD family transcriptional regulator
VIRNKEFANNPFLLSLAEAEVCNGLGIYTINHVGIAGYFFTARHDNKEAINFFINHLHLFVKIVNKVDKQLIRTGYWNNVNISTNNQKLFNIDDRRFIFGNKQLKNYSPLKIFLDEKEVQLTSRQVQTLDALKNISTTNDLANFLNTTSRTAEWHLSEIRKRTGLKGRSELIDFAMMYIK